MTPSNEQAITSTQKTSSITRTDSAIVVIPIESRSGTTELDELPFNGKSGKIIYCALIIMIIICVLTVLAIIGVYAYG
jgi:hypothetical protein